MESNIIHHGEATIIMNGGNPLEGCPKDWDEAKLIEEKLNSGKDEDEPQPRWKFDAGFKLDYDGALIRISSRFYPPKTHYGPTWDGTVHVWFMDKQIDEKKFDCATLEELQSQVEEYVDSIKLRLEKIFENKK